MEPCPAQHVLCLCGYTYLTLHNLHSLPIQAKSRRKSQDKYLHTWATATRAEDWPRSCERMMRSWWRRVSGSSKKSQCITSVEMTASPTATQAWQISVSHVQLRALVLPSLSLAWTDLINFSLWGSSDRTSHQALQYQLWMLLHVINSSRYFAFLNTLTWLATALTHFPNNYRVETSHYLS